MVWHQWLLFLVAPVVAFAYVRLLVRICRLPPVGFNPDPEKRKSAFPEEK